MTNDELDILEDSKAKAALEEPESDDDPAEIQAPKIDRRKKGNNVRTEKQVAAFEKVKEIRDQKRKERAELREVQKEELKKVIEEKVVKKAISIKKKQIKQQAALDEISDDETPIEQIKKIVARPKPVQPKPKITAHISAVKPEPQVQIYFV